MAAARQRVPARAVALSPRLRAPTRRTAVQGCECGCTALPLAGQPPTLQPHSRHAGVVRDGAVAAVADSADCRREHGEERVPEEGEVLGSSKGWKWQASGGGRRRERGGGSSQGRCSSLARTCPSTLGRGRLRGGRKPAGGAATGYPPQSQRRAAGRGWRGPSRFANSQVHLGDPGELGRAHGDLQQTQGLDGRVQG